MLTIENYHSRENNERYLSASQYKDFCGSEGIQGCEAMAMAKIRGEWEEQPTPAMVMSSYVDAHFSGRLDIFKAKNKTIFKNNGELKKSFEKAEKIIRRCESDEYFMKYMSGQKQVIMTAEIWGVDWKIAIDSFIPQIAIVDLKVMKALTDAHWVKDFGYCSFVTYYGYDIQAAIYQNVVEANTGVKLPFYIAGASKEDEPDIEIIGIDNQTIRNCEIEIEKNVKRIRQLKNGELTPDRCGHCDYCRATKILSKPIHFSELVKRI